MFTKYFVLLLMNSCLCLSQLTISPNKKEIQINEGDPLEITCTSDKLIDFFYPKSVKDLVVNSQENITDSVVNNVHTSRFKRQQTVYSDSGWYGCANLPEKYKRLNQTRFPFTPDIYTEQDVQWIYVFVKSTQHLFVDIPFLSQGNDGKYYIFGDVGDDVLLPCRPTSRDYNVKLYSGDKVMDTALYDPKRGMVIKNMQPTTLNYHCRVEDSDAKKEERREFQINLDGDSRFDRPFIDTESLIQMEIGKNFSMQCLANVWDRNKYFIGWVTPQMTYRIPKNVTTLEIYNPDNWVSRNRLVSLDLTIENVTEEDFGEYECRLYKYASFTTATIKLKKHELKHLRLSIRNPKAEYRVQEWYSFPLTVDVDAYPLPEFHWINPNGIEINNSWEFHNYDVNGERFSVQLLGHQFSLNDIGTHILFANNSDMNDTIEFKVAVGVPPRIIEVKHNKTFYLENEEAEFGCRATGFPVPNITWEYYNLDRTVVLPTYFKKIQTTAKDVEASSVVKMTMTISGFISCKASNDYGFDIQRNMITVDAFTTPSYDSDSHHQPLNSEPTVSSANPDDSDSHSNDKPTEATDEFDDFDLYRLGTINKEIETTEGSTILMHCVASMNVYNDVIKWYNSSNVLITGGRISIAETLVDPLLWSKLTISDVKKSDEGDYTCEGTAKNGSIVKNEYYVHVSASAALSASIIFPLSIILLSYLM